MTLDMAKVRADVSIRGMDIGLFKGVWPLDGWDYRRPVTITEQSGNDLTDYQVLVELNSTNFNFAHAQSNGEDIRFTDEEGNLLDYWIEEWDAVNETAKVWVKVPLIPANGTTNLYMYYGNPSASSESDGEATFIRVIDGVVGSWHFDEGSGDIAYDSSGNDNDGTIYGATWADGKFKKALSFDGSDDYVDCGNDDSLNITEELTIETWVNRGTITGTTFRYIVGKGTDYINEPYILEYDPANGYLRFGIYDGTSYHEVTTGLAEGEWAHLVGVFDGTSVKLYVNGIKKAETSFSQTTIDIQGHSVTIGGCDGGGRYFTGLIDEVRIYNKAVSEEEISDLYNNYGYTTENYPGKVLVRKYTISEPSVSVGAEETA